MYTDNDSLIIVYKIYNIIYIWIFHSHMNESNLTYILDHFLCFWSSGKHFFLLSIKSLAKTWFRWFISWRIFYFIHSSNLLILLYYIVLYLLILVLYCISVFVRLLFCIRIKLSIIIVWFWHKLQTFMNYFYVAPFQSGYHIIFSFLFKLLHNICC